MSKLTECPCCGYPHDDVEAQAMQRILNKMKADAVREAAETFRLLNGASIKDLLWYADKIERR